MFETLYGLTPYMPKYHERFGQAGLTLHECLFQIDDRATHEKVYSRFESLLIGGIDELNVSELRLNIVATSEMMDQVLEWFYIGEYNRFLAQNRLRLNTTSSLELALKNVDTSVSLNSKLGRSGSRF